jgi:hypothetical protein
MDSNQILLNTIRDKHNVYTLVDLAGCGTPDSSASIGAYFLTGVRDALVDMIGWGVEHNGLTVSEVAQEILDGDGRHEIADAAPSIYTHKRWMEFVDLCAYKEDISEVAGDTEPDMNTGAEIALYMIADRLVSALCQEIIDMAGDQDEEA